MMTTRNPCSKSQIREDSSRLEAANLIADRARFSYLLAMQESKPRTLTAFILVCGSNTLRARARAMISESSSGFDHLSARPPSETVWQPVNIKGRLTIQDCCCLFSMTAACSLDGGSIRRQSAGQLSRLTWKRYAPRLHLHPYPPISSSVLLSFFTFPLLSWFPILFCKVGPC